MNAAQVTHGLKTIGFGYRMWLGVAVIAAASIWLYKTEAGQRVGDALFA